MQMEVTPLQHLRRDALREIAQSNVQQSDALVKLFRLASSREIQRAQISWPDQVSVVR